MKNNGHHGVCLSPPNIVYNCDLFLMDCSLIGEGHRSEWQALQVQGLIDSWRISRTPSSSCLCSLVGDVSAQADNNQLARNGRAKTMSLWHCGIFSLLAIAARPGSASLPGTHSCHSYSCALIVTSTNRQLGSATRFASQLLELDIIQCCVLNELTCSPCAPHNSPRTSHRPAPHHQKVRSL